MRAVFPMLCVALFAACHAPSDSNSATGPGPTDVVSLLRAGDPKVCIDPLVQQSLERALASSTIMGEALYNKMVAAGRHLTFEAVTMSSRNRDIGEVTCNATLVSDPFKVPIDYTLRPTADGNQFTLSWTSDDPAQVVQGAIVSAVQPDEGTEAPPNETQSPSNASNNSLSARASGNVASNSETDSSVVSNSDVNSA